MEYILGFAVLQMVKFMNKMTALFLTAPKILDLLLLYRRKNKYIQILMYPDFFGRSR